MLVQPLSVSAQQRLDSRQQSLAEIVSLYSGVSYPLRKMHVTSPFGKRLHPIEKKWKLHNGIDLRAKNAEVYAMMDGEIIKTGYDRRSGKYIVIRHSSTLTVSYCHLSRILFPAGTKVEAGQTVCVSGNTGVSTAHHLHLVVKHKGKAIDPKLLFKAIENTKKEAMKRYLALVGL